MIEPNGKLGISYYIESVGDMYTGRAYLCVKCPRSHDGFCRFSLWGKPGNGTIWNWDGNVHKPTISPSINRLGGCERHFTIVAGEPK